MRKVLLSVFILLVGLDQACIADGGNVRPISIHFFANTVFEVNDKNGRSIKLDPPLMEYRSLEKWDSSEVATSPAMVDIAAVIESNDEVTEITVHVELYEKVGPLIINEEYGVTDFKAGLKLASWREKASLKKSIEVPKMMANETRFVIFTNVDIQNIINRRYSLDEWPYYIRVVASVSCLYCISNNAVGILEMAPGD